VTTRLYSFVNLAASATITASTQDSVYIATNAGQAADRYLPARTTVATDSWWLFDFTTATVLEFLELLRVNFTAARVQGNATDSWGSPSFNQLIAIDRNPFNEQYTFAAALTGFNYRYLRLFVATQTPKALDIDGPVLSVFNLGGLWAGLATSAPSGFGADVLYHRIEPRAVVKQRFGAWSKQASMGNTLVRLKLPRKARMTHAAPYAADEARSWLDIDGRAKAAGTFAFFDNTGNASLGWVVRSLNDETEYGVEVPDVMTNDPEYEEVIA
jgi:hypothetical protein